ncbi:MAG: hypothetical protein JOZ32_19085 [Bryobacterales bacterium]|nr:hypothetical protein [Bryobacterales bacterium]
MSGARFMWVDLQDRWGHYTRQGLYKIRRWPDFPKPVEVLGRGREPIWHLTDITAFENAHPELKSLAAKWRKVIGYRRARAKG